MRIAELLKSIQETPYPSEKIADLLFHFSQTEYARQKPIVHQSVWLAYGSVVRGVVSSTMDQSLIRENTREIKEKYAHIIQKEFETSNTIYDKILALKTMANAGIDLSVYELEKIIIDMKEELPDIMPRKIQNILMPIYKNPLIKIMHTLPRQPLLVQIVGSMEREPNQQVTSVCRDRATSQYDVIQA
uniref:Vitellogenin domain-containing protein n=1 Tax=Heterorhabditis bacteriophora TaxID=37862 RepID=A0A1I7WHR5_HETBA